ncbi:MAG: cytochrome c maturation protein CcmE [Thioalkalispiraceae bacterium]|jgi:cytochrome c-type biogenesis protein CcmE
MHPARARRLALVIVMLVAVFSAGGFIFYAFQENMMMYFTPSEVVAGKAPIGQRFNMGGMVAEGSVVKSSDTVAVRFDVTDYDKTITVTFSDILPDLFREGQAVITKGALNSEGLFVADEVLAKHDETYMPKEVADSLKNRDQHTKNNNNPPTGASPP